MSQYVNHEGGDYPPDLMEEEPRAFAEARSLLNQEDQGGDRFKAYWESLAHMSDPLKTPWKDLNEQLGYGGFMNDLTYILAASSVGKTYMLANLIHGFLLEGIRQLFFSFEMPYSSIVPRMMQIPCRRHYAAIVKSLRAVGRDAEVLVDNFARSGFLDNVAIVDHPVSLDVMDACVSLFRPQVVYIDHLDLIPAPRGMGGGNQWLEGQKASANWMMAARRKYNCAIFCLWQIGKPSGQGGTGAFGATMPSMAQGFGSSAVIASADNILGMCRPEIDRDNVSEADRRMLHIELLKRRNASNVPVTTVFLRYDPETSLLSQDLAPMEQGHYYGKHRAHTPETSQDWINEVGVVGLPPSYDMMEVASESD